MDYNKKIEHLIPSIRLYVEHGCKPSEFLTACLENDLKGAATRADSQNRYLLFEIVQYLHNEIPSNAWGSPRQVRNWMNYFRETR